MAELVNTVGTASYDGLIGGTQPALITKNVTIVSGAGVLPRGRVLGKITTSKKFTNVLSTASDGSQAPNCVLAYPVDATSVDVVATVYTSGMFNREHLTFGGSDTAAMHEDALRDLNIYLTSEKGAE